MVDYRRPGRPEERLSDAERAAAVAALQRHAADGRITADELRERSETAATARTWQDLVAPFSDLPELPAAGPAPAAPGGPAHTIPLGSAGAPAARPASTGPGGNPPAGYGPGSAGPGRTGRGPLRPAAAPAAAHPAGQAPSAGPAPSTDRASAPHGRRPRGGRMRPLGGRAGAAVMGATPIVAVVLFFLTGVTLGFRWAWLWFLAVPLMGAIIYAPWYEEE